MIAGVARAAEGARGAVGRRVVAGVQPAGGTHATTEGGPWSVLHRVALGTSVGACLVMLLFPLAWLFGGLDPLSATGCTLGSVFLAAASTIATVHCRERDPNPPAFRAAFQVGGAVLVAAGVVGLTLASLSVAKSMFAMFWMAYAGLALAAGACLHTAGKDGPPPWARR